MVASLAGWVIQALLEPYLGMGFAMVLSFAGSTVIFFMARKWLLGLRDG
jgi:hypothetical protein